jgi:hypothetical protein
MNRTWKQLILGCAFAATLVWGGSALALQTSAPKAATKKAVPAAVSDKDIADAKSKGMVWVNTSTKVYHKDGEFYGKTKQGKFMAEPDAMKAGFKAAKEPVSKKKATDSKK